MLVLSAVFALSACTGTSEFNCQEDGDCGSQGRCEASGYCSFPDDDCASGRRYGNLAGTGLADKCVSPDEGTDASSTATSPSGGSVTTATTSGSSTTTGPETTGAQSSSSGETTGSDEPTPIDFCPPLPPPAADQILVEVTPDDASALDSMVNAAPPDTTFLLAPGQYDLDDSIWISAPGITLRSASGDPTDVVFDSSGSTENAIVVDAPGVTIAEMTVQRSASHLIFITASDADPTDGTMIYGMRLVDPGLSAVRGNFDVGPADNTTIACSTIEVSDERRRASDGCGFSGIRGFGVANWTIRDNDISGFWCPTEAAGPSISINESSFDNVIERNRLVDVHWGIQLGLAEDVAPFRDVPDPPCDDGYYGHYRGVVRNNMIAAVGMEFAASAEGFYSGILLWQVCDVEVSHNTIASAVGEVSSIEYRFERTTAAINNNLATGEIRVRDDAGAPVAGNVELAELTEFIDPLAGDLHLRPDADAVDAGVNLGRDAPDVDIDGDPRVDPADIGADEVIR